MGHYRIEVQNQARDLENCESVTWSNYVDYLRMYSGTNGKSRSRHFEYEAEDLAPRKAYSLTIRTTRETNGFSALKETLDLKPLGYS